MGVRRGLFAIPIKKSRNPRGCQDLSRLDETKNKARGLMKVIRTPGQQAASSSPSPQRRSSPGPDILQPVIIRNPSVQEQDLCCAAGHLPVERMSVSRLYSIAGTRLAMWLSRCLVCPGAYLLGEMRNASYRNAVWLLCLPVYLAWEEV